MAASGARSRAEPLGGAVPKPPACCRTRAAVEDRRAARLERRHGRARVAVEAAVRAASPGAEAATPARPGAQSPCRSWGATARTWRPSRGRPWRLRRVYVRAVSPGALGPHVYVGAAPSPMESGSRRAGVSHGGCRRVGHAAMVAPRTGWRRRVAPWRRRGRAVPCRGRSPFVGAWCADIEAELWRGNAMFYLGVKPWGEG